MSKKIIFILVYILATKSFAQVVGHVLDSESKKAISFANVYWKLDKSGVYSDTLGYFNLKASSVSNDTLIVSAVGYEGLSLSSQFPKEFLLKSTSLRGAVITSSQATMVHQDAVGIQSVITEAGLQKSACCNLAEAFETNGAVDVSFADAISGVKQVRLLGLDGKYVPITFEGLPHLRGLSSLYGLGYIPGPFLESIMVSKGPGSVTLGNESMTGQINVEFKKPRDMEKLHLNAYLNMMGRAELNVISSHKINKNWSTAIFGHGNVFRLANDRNKDGFLDLPFAHQANIQNRWYYEKGNVEFQAGAKYLYDAKQGGQTDYFRNKNENAYNFNLSTHRAEAWFKNGYLFTGKPFRSFAWMGTFAYHDQKGNYGVRAYDGRQRTGYLNAIFQDKIVHTAHMYKVGASFMFDRVNEVFGNTNVYREEYIPGVFAEYKFSHVEKFWLIAGMRYDYNSKFGHQTTPRLQIRYSPTKDLAIKLTGGRGYRSPSVFSDNASVLVSNRVIALDNIKAEISWNGGGGLLYKFSKGKVNGSLGVDYFYTWFENQLIANMETQGFVSFQNVHGASSSHAMQLDFMLEPVNRLQFHLNAKYNRVMADYNGVQKLVPFIPEWRGLFNVSYKTRGANYWAFDFTVQVNGPARLPKTQDPILGTESREKSPVYPLLFAQVSKKIKRWEIYIGGENLTDYRQKNPIISAADPFSPKFDASQVWAPVFGAMAYGGFRYVIK